ncbi:MULTISPECIES: protein-L-isoaspartate(D-aspartate) O-methyltransferase [unclassified Wenzhouxiangella]|uniref:protein-L-isoaspartate(D-aspartate) O-methyltransferase n=1 Tax=unclassified Wenzhouxiangella TaxID=2613841 RepID=UPI000E327328|nr:MULTISPECIES: protein-L-isoaspartate(D-aspartate) O-methyltransferase [unclassified Wenzhouxiangella]RFF26695.1 protein-L-isoaspartate(D-aspartate) O-methyltransferase [Wenzhouxiangella sp. 15181]RFP69335.1 protein-L-isoaspartate(D-aspartate) O-methyltransferase [Wenzhouxiangella sp. 15190]
MRPSSLITLAAILLSVAAVAEPPQPELLLEGGGSPPAQYPDERASERAHMVDGQVAARGVDSERVLEAMRDVPRHRFVPEAQRRQAYDDRPLPIGHGQTISQPYMVAFMSEELDVEPGDRVLEVGTGSGYQAAVLAAMGVEVVSIEIIPELAESAAEKLASLDFGNVTVLAGDGYYGHAEGGPYDGIIVTAAADHVPPPLVEQLEPGERMIIPVGRSGWQQNLLRVEKRPDGSTRSRNLMAVRFVPLTGDH